MIVRQRRHRTSHGIHPFNLALGAIEQVVAPVFFVERQNPHQQNLAEVGVVKVGVVQGLGVRLHRVLIDALAGGGVVLHLESDVAPKVVNKQGVGNVQMRRTALYLAVTANGFPGETETVREGQVALAPVVHVSVYVAIRLQFPAEHPQVVQLVPNTERHQQHALEDDKLRQGGGVVVLLQFPEVCGEAGIGQERAFDGGFGHFETAVAVIQVVQPEHILNRQRLAQAELEIEAEQQFVPKTNHIPCNGIVFGSDPGPAKYVHAGTAENLFPGLIQPGHLLPELPALLFQPPLDGFEGRAFLNNAFKAGAIRRHTKSS